MPSNIISNINMALEFKKGYIALCKCFIYYRVDITLVKLIFFALKEGHRPETLLSPPFTFLSRPFTLLV
jgi:hypothetical protein